MSDLGPRQNAFRKNLTGLKFFNFAQVYWIQVVIIVIIWIVVLLIILVQRCQKIQLIRMLVSVLFVNNSLVSYITGVVHDLSTYNTSLCTLKRNIKTFTNSSTTSYNTSVVNSKSACI